LKPEKSQVKRWKYALAKETIERAIQDLKDWQEVFDPSWYLIMKAATPQIDVELSKGRHGPVAAPLSTAFALRAALKDGPTSSTLVFLPANRLQSIRSADIPFCSARIGERPGSATSLILDPVNFPSTMNITILPKTFGTSRESFLIPIH
jgi:hypothetical protein